MPRSPSVLVIDPSVHQSEEECTRVALAGWSPASRLLRPALAPRERSNAAALRGHDALILLGSHASVHDEADWARDLTDLLLPILSGDDPTPLLAICYGHQLVAHLAGGAVGPADPAGDTKRSGVEVTRFSGSRLVPDGELRAVVSHFEAVTRPPAGYTVVASRPGVPCDALEHPDREVYSVQFHPEARGEFLAQRGHDPALATGELSAGMDRLLSAFRDRVGFREDSPLPNGWAD